tara:strand:- start:2447 stop:2881 length:435 start_codon:yes stop_codon:yes gene_type:complete
MRILFPFIFLMLSIMEAGDIKDWSSYESIEAYIESDDLSYYETKQRAQSVVEELRIKADLAHKNEILKVRKTYQLLKRDMPNSVFPKRESIVIEHTNNEYKYWKKQIEAKRELVIEEYMGGSGAYYAANMLEIKEILKRINDYF